jgi:hypothetical protein
VRHHRHCVQCALFAKGKAEVGVQVVQRWIVAALRKRKFFSLEEVNRAIAELLARLNERPFRKRPGSRATLFAQLDRPALKPLPATRFQFGEWETARVNIDYHIEVGRHFYSVPYALVMEAILAAKRHPEQGYRSCLGILRLAKTYPAERMEAAARRCLRARAYNFQSMDSILKNQLDRLPLPGDPPVRSAVEHDNIRGAGYFDSPPEIDPPVVQ